MKSSVGLTYETGGAGAEHEDAGSQAGADFVETVAGAGSGLKEGRVDIGEVMDLEDLACGISAVLGEATVHGDTVSLELGWGLDVSKWVPAAAV